MQFEWDVKKAERNVRKHKLTFAEAATVFYDPLAAIFDDEAHSAFEQREVIIGHSIHGRLLMVSFAEKSRNRIRLISARRATRRERKDYEENKRT
jgi:hypothetical protein